MKRVHYVPNSITAFSLMCGLFIIFKTNMIEVGGSTFDSLQKSAILLLLAGFADLMDGAVARAMRAESSFGGVFDSLADAVTFGVAPSVMMLKSLSISPGTQLSFLAATGAMVFSVCGVLRLVRFTSEKPLEVEGEKSGKGNFTGLPIPAAAGAAVSMNLLLVSPEGQNWWGTLPVQFRAMVLSLTMIGLGYFMLSRWKFPSLKALEFRLPSFSLLFITILAVLFIFFGLLSHFSVVLFVLTWGYVAVAWSLSLIRLVLGRRSKALEDFEPEPESDMDQ